MPADFFRIALKIRQLYRIVNIQQQEPKSSIKTLIVLRSHSLLALSLHFVYNLTQTKNSLLLNQQTAFLEVVIPPDIIYEETSGDMMVPEGSSAKLICKARGFPKPKVNRYLLLWHKFRNVLALLLPRKKTLCFIFFSILSTTKGYMAKRRWTGNNRTKWFTWQDKRFVKFFFRSTPFS